MWYAKVNIQVGDDGIMELFLTVLGLLVLIGLSNIVNHFIPVIPVPLIQIGLGIIVVSSFRCTSGVRTRVIFPAIYCPVTLL